MAQRSIELLLKAQVGQFVAGLKTARGAVNDTARDVAGFVRNNEQDMRTAGTAVATFGAGLTALSVGAVKAAMDWESSWADVQKVNDGTHDQMVRLEEDLREMARTIPATHEEIAAVAEAAGRLGVGVDDVASFSRVMIDLGNTTDMSADQAATAIARFSTITGTSFDDADRLGSTIVDLGNNFAATETEIMDMSSRIAAAGSQAGLTEGEIMGLAAAMSQVDIAAEAGGTAMTMTFNEIDAAVREGGESLEGWADLAGASAQEFAQAWQNDPAQAIEMVVTGLGQVAAEGGDVNGILQDLGINGVRQADVLRRLSQDAEGLGAAFEMGNQAFEENSALSEEAAIRYETAAMKIKTAWASIQDAFITAGSAIAPMVGDVAEHIGSAADAFGSLPDPVLNAVTALSGVAGVSALGAGGLALLAPRAVETWDAFRRLQKSAGPAATFIKNAGRAAGIAAVGFAALKVVDSLTDNFNVAVGTIQEFETELRLLGEGASEGAAGLDELFAARDYSSLGILPTGIRDLDSAINALDTRALPEFFEEAITGFGLFGDTAQDIALEGLEQFDGAMSAMVNSGDLDSAAAGFREWAEAAEDAGWSTERIANATPEYTAALQEMASQYGYNLEGAELYEAALGNLPPKLQELVGAADEAARQDQLIGALEEVGVAADGTVESLSDYLDMLFQTGLAEQSAMQAQASYQEALDGVGAAVDQITETHGGLSEVLNSSKDGFDLTTEAGRTAQGAFLDVASSGMDMAQAMADAGESQDTIQEGLQGTYDDLISAAGEFGITGDAAEELARSVLGVPDGVDIESWMDETAKQTAEDTKAAIFQLPDDVDIDTFMSDAAYRQSVLTKAGVDDIPDSDTVQAIMTDDAFVEAVRTRAAVLDIPEEDVVDAFMSAAARGEANETEAAILDVPEGVDVSSWMSSDGRGEAESFEGILNRIDGRRTSSWHTHTMTTKQRTILENVGGVGGAIGRGADGGRAGTSALPRKSTGGRLPSTGLGTDEILGVNALGNPVAWVDDLEWIVNRRSSDKYDSVLDRINRDHPSVHHLAHLRDGGRAGQLASTAMGMAPQVSVSAPPVDTAAIGAAVAHAMSGFQPMVKIGNREFHGVMRDVSNQFRSL